MNNSANISGSFPPDAQGSDTLYAQSGQESGKALEAAMRRFGEGVMESMGNATGQSGQAGSGGMRSPAGLPARMTAKRLPGMPGRNGRAENIAAKGQAFAVPPHSRHLPAFGKAFAVRRGRGGGHIVGAGARKPWREAG